MATAIAKAPLLQYEFLLDIWTGSAGSISRCYGCQTRAECESKIKSTRNVRDWEIRKRDGDKFVYHIDSK